MKTIQKIAWVAFAALLSAQGLAGTLVFPMEVNNVYSQKSGKISSLSFSKAAGKNNWVLSLYTTIDNAYHTCRIFSEDAQKLIPLHRLLFDSLNAQKDFNFVCHESKLFSTPDPTFHRVDLDYDPNAFDFQSKY